MQQNESHKMANLVENGKNGDFLLTIESIQMLIAVECGKIGPRKKIRERKNSIGKTFLINFFFLSLDSSVDFLFGDFSTVFTLNVLEKINFWFWI